MPWVRARTGAPRASHRSRVGFRCLKPPGSARHHIINIQQTPPEGQPCAGIMVTTADAKKLIGPAPVSRGVARRLRTVPRRLLWEWALKACGRASQVRGRCLSWNPLNLSPPCPPLHCLGTALSHRKSSRLLGPHRSVSAVLFYQTLVCHHCRV